MYPRAGFSAHEIDTAADRFGESLVIFGDEGPIRERLHELRGTAIAELAVQVLAVADPAREMARMAAIIGTLYDRPRRCLSAGGVSG